jgi:hypothetical protein
MIRGLLMKLCLSVLGLFVGLAAADAAISKKIVLLDGKVVLHVPPDFVQATNQTKPKGSYTVLTLLESGDRGLSVKVTYGHHTAKMSELGKFLDQKFSEYSILKEKLPRFRWLDHRLVERDGRQWVDMRFAHGLQNTKEREVYTHCVSTILNEHLLEIWVVTHRAPDSAEKALVDEIIQSVRVTSQ